LNNIDLSIPRRSYFSDECQLTICPECGSGLIEESCAILIAAISDSDEGEFMTNLSGSHFCNKCPVVVFDRIKVDQGARLGIRGDKNLRYSVSGILDLDSIPENKRHLVIGSEGNPIPLVHFLPDKKNKTAVATVKYGRNTPCTCGSGKKYKKCCGK